MLDFSPAIIARIDRVDNLTTAPMAAVLTQRRPMSCSDLDLAYSIMPVVNVRCRPTVYVDLPCKREMCPLLTLTYVN